MIRVPRIEHRPVLPALGNRARRALDRLRGAEPAHRPTADRRPAVFSASLGCHPHL
ncbi:hypothetical protein [Nocardia blacklockiae]|uniref:hypothetical protein n=1 Tax=Nocardia blacklockiae TaxID=480036 RepID=UPI001894F2A1|nr:hypothetical protein [Nocardia blacklockiae]MBF6175555.1 hypothetical protein [Nocardia blacklockiae]